MTIACISRANVLALALAAFLAPVEEIRAQAGPGANLTGKVYVLLPRTTAIRFEKWDHPYLVEALKKHSPKLEVIVLNAQDSAAEQERQFETALANRAKGIILACVNPDAAGGMLTKAKVAGVPVVNHANQCNGGPVAYRVLASFEQVGEDQAKYVASHLPPSPRPLKVAKMFSDPTNALYKAWVAGFDKYFKPLIDNGTVQIVCQADAGSWAPAKVQANMEQCLTKVNNAVDAVMVMNDDTGNGVIAALQAQGLQGKVKLFGGYDATVAGVQRVLAGWQVSDMYAPYRTMADRSVQMLISEIAKTPPPAGFVVGTVDNKFMQVPAVPLENTLVTPDNVQKTVVDAGLWSKAELCDPKGIASATAFCK
jgi:D-xylose transport system substrate-binding protein